ncbi:MAG TPA: PocR ligand-binding domain-containing protein, partial [Syntrophorhabdaceae bacterium]
MSMNRTILLVEDEAMIAIAGAEKVRSFGFHVIVAPSGKKAVELASRKEKIDLVLMDLDLGSEMSGAEAARRILSLRSLPVVFLTSHSFEESGEGIKDIPLCGYVVKGSGDYILRFSIEAAFELFESRRSGLRHSPLPFHEGKDEVPVLHEGNDSLGLSDLIDSEALQPLVDDFCRLTGIGAAVVDLEGKILVSSGWQEICTKFHRLHPESRRNCVESDITLTRGAVEGTFNVYKCKNNMMDLATPIMAGPAHVGNLFLGQFLFDDEMPDYDLFRAQAKRYGFDEKAYMTALEQVPRRSKEAVNASMSFFSKFARIISQLSLNRLNLSRALTERDRSLILLKEKEELLENQVRLVTTLLDTVPSPIYYKNRSGRFLGCNRAFEEFRGMARKRIIGRTVRELDPTKEADKYEEMDRLLYANQGVQTFEWRARTASGAARDVIFRKALFRDAAGSVAGIAGVMTDITEQKKAQEKLKRLTDAMEASMEGMAVIGGNELLVYVNKSFAAVYGYSMADELVGQSWRLLYEDNEIRRFDRYILPQFRRHGQWQGEATGKRKDESFFPQEVSLTALDHGGSICVVRDTSVRKKIDEVQLFLLQSGYARSGGEFFKSLARYLAWTLEVDYVCIDRLSGQDHKAKTLAIYFDGTFEDNVEYTLADTPCEEVVGKTICSFPQKVRDLFPRDEILREMGAESYVGTTLWGSDGRPIGLIAVIARRPMEDTRLVETVLKLAAIRAAGELERRDAQGEIEALLSEKELLLREVHHRIKNNMNVIMSLLALQASRLKDPTVVAALADARSRVQSMMVLYDKLYRSADFRNISADQYLNSLIDEIARNFPGLKSVRVEKNIEPFILDARVLSSLGIIL